MFIILKKKKFKHAQTLGSLAKMPCSQKRCTEIRADNTPVGENNSLQAASEAPPLLIPHHSSDTRQQTH